MSAWSPFADIDSSVLSRAQVRELDRVAIERFAVPGIVLMENAGRGAADAILRELVERAFRRRPRIAVVCGRGNNGGDGYVVARQLLVAGCEVELWSVSSPMAEAGDAAAMRAIVDRLGLPVAPLDEASIASAARTWATFDVLIDALLGTGFRGPLSSMLSDIVRAFDGVRGPLKVALDVPSGLDADTGEPSPVAVRADLTVTFAARKLGLASEAARPFVGRLAVAHIGAPTRMLERERGA